MSYLACSPSGFLEHAGALSKLTADSASAVAVADAEVEAGAGAGVGDGEGEGDGEVGVLTAVAGVAA